MKWSDIAADPKYQQLSADKQQKVREAYFKKKIAPKLAPEDLQPAAEAFAQRAEEFDRDVEGQVYAEDNNAIVNGVARGALSLTQMLPVIAYGLKGLGEAGLDAIDGGNRLFTPDDGDKAIRWALQGLEKQKEKFPAAPAARRMAEKADQAYKKAVEEGHGDIAAALSAGGGFIGEAWDNPHSGQAILGTVSELIPSLATGGPVSSALKKRALQQATEKLLAQEAAKRFASKEAAAVAKAPLLRRMRDAGIVSGTISTTATLGPNVAEGLRDGLTLPEAMQRGSTRTAVQTGVDTATGGLSALRFAASPVRNALVQVGKDMAGGGLGEYAAAKAVGDEISPSGITAETLYEVVGLPLEMATARAEARGETVDIPGRKPRQGKPRRPQYKPGPPGGGRQNPVRGVLVGYDALPAPDETPGLPGPDSLASLPVPADADPASLPPGSDFRAGPDGLVPATEPIYSSDGLNPNIPRPMGAGVDQQAPGGPRVEVLYDQQKESPIDAGGQVPDAGGRPQRTDAGRPRDIGGIPVIKFADIGKPGATFGTHYAGKPDGELSTGITRIRTPEDAAHLFAPLRKEGQEHLLAAVTDAKGNVLKVIRHTSGTRSSSQADFSILIPSVTSVPGGKKLWLSHNHPSGNMNESLADLRITEAIERVLAPGQMELGGHVIVGDGGKARFIGADNKSKLISIKPAARKAKMPMERIGRRRKDKIPYQITSPYHAVETVRKLKKAGVNSGVLLLDNKHSVVGSVAVPPGQIAILGKRGRGKKIAKALEQSGAVAAILFGEEAHWDKGFNNLANWLTRMDLRVLDYVSTDAKGLPASFLERGVDTGNKTDPVFSLLPSEPFSGETREQYRARVERTQTALSLLEVATENELFSTPRAKSDTLEGVFEEYQNLGLLGDITIEEMPVLGASTFTPHGLDNYTTSWYIKRTEGDEEPAWVYQYGDSVLLEISEFKPGQGGGAIYQAVMDFAHNAGLVFIGDPAGLSSIAQYRRTEQMFSSAVKWGTTRHMAPHALQENPDTEGVEPLKWVGGDDVHNIGELMRVIVENTRTWVEGFDDLYWNWKDGRFYSRRAEGVETAPESGTQQVEQPHGNGKALSERDFDDIIDRTRNRKSLPAGRNDRRARIDTPPLGVRTLQRAVLIKSLWENMGEMGRLTELGENVLRLHNALGEALKKVFYFKQNPEKSGFFASSEQIRDTAKRLGLNPDEITIAATENDLPANIRKQIKAQNAQGQVAGVFDKGQVYVVQSNILGEAHLEEVLAHEAFGHRNLRRLLGKDFGVTLDALYDELGKLPGLRKLAKQYGIEEDFAPYLETVAARGGAPDTFSRLMLVDELLAVLQQKRQIESLPAKVVRLWRELVAKVVAALRERGFIALANLLETRKIRLSALLKAMRDADGEAKGAGVVFSRTSKAVTAEIMLEAAPNPENVEATEKWNQMPVPEQTASTAQIADLVIPSLLELYGVRGQITPTIGGYLAEVNPSLTLDVDTPEKANEIASMLGNALSQHSMLVTSNAPAKEFEETGLISVHLKPGADIEDARKVYNRLRKKIPNGEDLVSGFTMRDDGVMQILNFSGEDTSKVARLVKKALPGRKVETSTVYTSFIGENKYGPDKPEGFIRGTAKERAWLERSRRIVESYFADLFADEEADQQGDGGTRLGHLGAADGNSSAGRGTEAEAGSGNETPEEEPRFSLTPRPTRAQTTELFKAVKNALDVGRYWVQDRFIDLKRVIEEAGYDPSVAGPYMREALWSGRARARIDALDTGLVESIRHAAAEAIKAAKRRGRNLTPRTIDEWLVARHAEEANAYLKRINPDMPDNEALSGMTNEEAAEILRQWADNEELQRLGRLVDQLNREKLDYAVSEGLIDAETAETWRNTYLHYVPLFREGHQSTVMGPTAKGFSTGARLSKRRVGSTRAPKDVLANTVAQYYQTIVQGEKARVARSLLEFAQQVGIPGVEITRMKFQKAVKPPKAKIRAAKAALADLLIRRPPGWEAEAHRLNQEIERMKKGEVTTVPNPQEYDNEIKVRVGSDVYTMIFDLENPRAARMIRALKNLDNKNAGWLVRSLLVATRLLAALATRWNLSFFFSNPTRDVQTAAFNLTGTPLEGKEKEFAKMWPGMFRDAVRAELGWGVDRIDPEVLAYYDEYKHAGGPTGWLDNFRKGDEFRKGLEKEITRMAAGKHRKNRPARFFETVDALNEAAENASRVSAYILARKQGLNAGQAAFLAKELTVNFNRKGEAGLLLNSLYMFFSTGVNGTVRLAQTFRRNPGRAMKMAGGLIALGFLSDMMSHALSGEDDDGQNRYDNMLDTIKQRSVVLWFPGMDAPITIPTAWGLNVFTATGQALARVMREPEAAGDQALYLLDTALGAFNPLQSTTIAQTVAPTVLDPFVQMLENKTWFGAPLKKEPFDRTNPPPEYTLAWRSTSEISKAISKWLNDHSGGNAVRPGAINVPPAWLDLAGKTLGGGAAASIVQATKGVGSLLGLVDDYDARNIPGVRTFLARPDESGVSRRFYMAAEDAGYLRKEQRTGMDLTPEQQELAWAYKQTTKRLRKLNQELRNLEADTRMAGFLRKRKIEEVKKEIRREQADFNRLYYGDTSTR